MTDQLPDLSYELRGAIEAYANRSARFDYVVQTIRSYGLQCYRMGVEAERERAVPVLIPIALEKAMDLADAYVVAATGDTATARHKVSSARAALRAHLEGWGRLAESQQALEEMGKRIEEISARYGLGESAAAIRGTDTE